MTLRLNGVSLPVDQYTPLPVDRCSPLYSSQLCSKESKHSVGLVDEVCGLL